MSIEQEARALIEALREFSEEAMPDALFREWRNVVPVVERLDDALDSVPATEDNQTPTRYKG